MPGDEQRRIAKTYITAFLPATLQARREHLYTLTLPAGTAANWRLTQTSTLKFFVAPMNEDVDLPGRKKGRRKREREKKKEEETKNQGKEKKKERESPDFTIELVDNDGATVTSAVSRFVRFLHLSKRNSRSSRR